MSHRVSKKYQSRLNLIKKVCVPMFAFIVRSVLERQFFVDPLKRISTLLV